MLKCELQHALLAPKKGTIPKSLTFPLKKKHNKESHASKPISKCSNTRVNTYPLWATPPQVAMLVWAIVSLWVCQIHISVTFPPTSPCQNSIAQLIYLT